MNILSIFMNLKFKFKILLKYSTQKHDSRQTKLRCLSFETHRKTSFIIKEKVCKQEEEG